jgi:hypothetical protein
MRFRVALVTGVLLLAGCDAAPVGPNRTEPYGTGSVGAPLPVEVVVGAELFTLDGGRTSLAWAGDDVRAYRVPAGLLVVGEPDAWLVTPDGVQHRLASHVDGLTVAPAGDRLAYRSGNTLTIVTVAAPPVVVASTDGVNSFYPQRFLNDAVLLTRSDPDGSTAAYDVWHPGQGAYEATVPADVHQLVASTPDGRVIFVGVPHPEGLCLFRMSPVRAFELTPGPCDLGLTMGGGTWPVSPDGRWMLGLLDGTKDRGNPVALVDLTSTGPAAVAGTWPDDPARELRLDTAVWLDARTAVVGGRGGVARLTVTNVGAIEWFPVRADAPAVPVPRLISA